MCHSNPKDIEAAFGRKWSCAEPFKEWTPLPSSVHKHMPLHLRWKLDRKRCFNLLDMSLRKLQIPSSGVSVHAVTCPVSIALSFVYHHPSLSGNPFICCNMEHTNRCTAEQNVDMYCTKLTQCHVTLTVQKWYQLPSCNHITQISQFNRRNTKTQVDCGIRLTLLERQWLIPTGAWLLFALLCFCSFWTYCPISNWCSRTEYSWTLYARLYFSCRAGIF